MGSGDLQQYRYRKGVRKARGDERIGDGWNGRWRVQSVIDLLGFDSFVEFGVSAVPF